LRARLAHGAPLESVAYAAPEAIAGYDVGPASDVYSLAAVTFATVTGYAPLGQVELEGASPSLTALARCVRSALDQAPHRRPTMSTLADALAHASTLCARAHLAPSAPSTFGPTPSPAPLAPSAPPTSPVLAALMVVGGLIAAIGAVQLVLKTWDIFGEVGHVVTLSLLSAIAAGASELCKRKGIRSGVTVGVALSALFGTVATAYTFYLLDDYGRLALAMLLAPVAWIAGAFAQRTSFHLGAAIARTCAAIFAMVASGYGLYLLDDRGRLALWLALSVIVGSAGLYNARAPTTPATNLLLALGTQLLWGAGMQALLLLKPDRYSGPLAVISGCVATVTLVFALFRRSSWLLGALAALDCALFAGAFGVYLRTGSVMGPAGFALAVSFGYAALSALAARWRAPATAGPMTLGAALSAVSSALLAVVVVEAHWSTHGPLAAAWPYGIIALCALTAALSERARAAATLTALALAWLIPTSEALVRANPALTALASVAGVVTILAASVLAPLRDDRGPRASWLLAGIFSTLAAPTVRALGAVGHAPMGEYSNGPWWTLFVATSSLLALSFALSTRVDRSKSRALEASALSVTFGMLALQCVAAPERTSFVVIALLGGATLTALGAATRRAFVFVGAAIALIVHLWVQYFVRLEEVFPKAVLLIGFGVGLLVIGVLYDQLARPRMSQLRTWR
jgi:hypothetical protein